MDENKTGANQAQDQGALIRNLAADAYKSVETALGLVPIKCLSQVDFAERAIVRMRDALIDELRREPNKDEKYRRALERANVALSMVVGVEYPATGSQQKSLQMACDVLREANDELNKT